MKNARGFESWLICQGVPETQTPQKLTHVRVCETAIMKDVDDWNEWDVILLLNARGGPLGRALRTPGKLGASLLANYAHSSKLYVGYRISLTPAGPDLDRLQRVLDQLEQLCPSLSKWAGVLSGGHA